MEPAVDIYVPQRGSAAGRHYFPRVSDVEWTDEVHGCSEASFTMHDPIVVDLLTADCPVWISDPTDGELLFTGNVVRNGIEVTAFGDSATVRVVGNTDQFYSNYWSLPYRVQDFKDWGKETIKYASGKNWKVNTGVRPADPPWDAVVIDIDKGDALYSGTGGRAQYAGHLGSDMMIGGLTFNADNGTGLRADLTSPTTMRTEMFVGDEFWGKMPWRVAWDTTSVDVAEAVYGSTSSTVWPLPSDPHVSPPRDDTENYIIIKTLEGSSTGTDPVENENMWFAASQMIVMGLRVNRWGEHQPWASSQPDRLSLISITAADIVEDLVGRCLRGIVDPQLLDVNHTSGWNIGTANYRDPTSPGEILDDLVKFHPDHLWRVGLRSPTDGLSPLEWRPWATTPRYVADWTRVEVDMESTPDPLYNKVSVRYPDWRGRTKTVTVTADQYPAATYPDVESIQGYREPAPIDLDESLGQHDNASRIAEKWLSQVAVATPAGSITVTEPILDVDAAVLVTPAKLQAGQTICVGPDQDVTVHRIQSVKHRGLDEAVLTVGRPRLDLDFVVDHRGYGRK